MVFNGALVAIYFVIYLLTKRKPAPEQIEEEDGVDIEEAADGPVVDIASDKEEVMRDGHVVDGSAADDDGRGGKEEERA